MLICGLDFLPYNGLAECDLERDLPENVLIHPLSDGALFAVKAQIGKEPHPLICFFEAATYKDGAWIVGIDRLQNRYFTPVFEKGD